MPSWNPDLYLRFAAERTRPCRELLARVALESPARVIDLGCGPGNSTEVAAQRFPDAALEGLDSSADMIETARQSGLRAIWTIGDITRWAAEPGPPMDLIFSNAAFQWVPDHGKLLPALMARLGAGGALAFQVPADPKAPPHEATRQIAATPPWSVFFRSPVREWDVRPAEIYYDLLAPLASRIDLWSTDYVQVMPNAAAIADWYKGTGLRPFLDLLPDEMARTAFVAAYEARLAEIFPARPDGRVLFVFRRLFCIAYRD